MISCMGEHRTRATRALARCTGTKSPCAGRRTGACPRVLDCTGACRTPPRCAGSLRTRTSPGLRPGTVSQVAGLAPRTHRPVGADLARSRCEMPAGIECGMCPRARGGRGRDRGTDARPDRRSRAIRPTVPGCTNGEVTVGVARPPPTATTGPGAWHARHLRRRRVVRDPHSSPFTTTNLVARVPAEPRPAARSGSRHLPRAIPLPFGPGRPAVRPCLVGPCGGETPANNDPSSHAQSRT